LLAIWYAADRTPLSAPLTITSDSRYGINGLTKHLPKWADMGWIGISNAYLFQATAAILQRRGNKSYLEWVKGHNGNAGNEGADELAGAGTELEHSDLNVHIPQRFRLTGAKLVKATQSLLYKGLRMKENKPVRNRTSQELSEARQGVKNLCGRTLTDAQIWDSIRHRDFSRGYRTFIWRVLHAGFKCGSYWENIQNYEHRGTCPCCNDTSETTRHILTECSARGRVLIWSLAKRLWERKGMQWPNAFSYGTILGCGVSDFKTGDGKRLPGANRLWRILISESAHLIWKLCCIRRIQHEDDPEMSFSHNEIHNKWVFTMNQRLSLDRSTSNKMKFGTKATRPDLVLKTWNGTLLNEENLPENWLWQAGVLVGIPSRRTRDPRPDG
ncbi:uncharacterized protein STEHIDRAFT_49333, partial [Stereum hirsutum FP-91666 SS1]|uniref:uncharacterized protein n=1 Tax=Stereum hirsutum (strain FP-91666) TaxID=721885 RepID=UPI000440B1BC